MYTRTFNSYRYSSSSLSYSTDENLLLPDSFRDMDSLLPSTPATVSPDIYFASNPSTTRSPTPVSDADEDLLLHELMRPLEVDSGADLGLRRFPEASPQDSSALRGSYDNFFRLGYRQRRCAAQSRGSAKVGQWESDSDYASSSNYGSDADCDSDSNSDSDSDRNDSESDSSTDAELLDLEDALPSFCATAVKVKITPLCAVRRTVRRSYLLDASRFAPRKSSADDHLGAENPYWGIFVAMAARDAPATDGSQEDESARTEPHPHPRAQAQPQGQGQWSTLTRKFSMDNLRAVIARKPSTAPIGPLDDVPAGSAQAAAHGVQDQDAGDEADADADSSINIMEFHDVTQEAARLAAMMSFRWEYKTVVPQKQRC